MFKQSLANVYLKVAMNKSRAVMWYLLLHWKKRWLLKHILQGSVSAQSGHVLPQSTN